MPIVKKKGWEIEVEIKITGHITLSQEEFPTIAEAIEEADTQASYGKSEGIDWLSGSEHDFVAVDYKEVDEILE